MQPDCILIFTLLKQRLLRTTVVALNWFFTARYSPAHKVRRGDGEAATLCLVDILGITVCY